ncbi:Rieske 2Fe-2S domain-containing protein [Plantactinospora sp. GCM10030261]|uniref:Rieske 2Fe-2S domain-containing protein n=1 Tax=Plantactinospora sp. GCM10030261 TaxID=3273420 RepID=UPI00360FE07C
MRELLTKLERASRLDAASEWAQRAVGSVLRSQRLRDVLHGVWLGHPLHPAMVQVPVGAWSSAAILDLLPGQRRAATVLVGVGTAAALPAAVAGWNDWAALNREQRRVGLVHAAANIAGVTLYAGSFAARLAGRHGVGRTLAYLGLAAAGGGAYLGGHLAYKQAAQVNQSVAETHRLSEDWRPVADLDQVPDSTLVSRTVDDVDVVLYRDGESLTVMLDRCAHQSGPLGAGKVVTVNGRACVECPWHASRFRLDNGQVVQGPAGTDQQVLPVRVVAGVIETRLP